MQRHPEVLRPTNAAIGRPQAGASRTAESAVEQIRDAERERRYRKENRLTSIDLLFVERAVEMRSTGLVTAQRDGQFLRRLGAPNQVEALPGVVQCSEALNTPA